MFEEHRPYRRKMRRARKHLDEMESVLGVYGNRHPCEPIRDREAARDPREWVYRAHLMNQPTDDLDLILGDFIHNVRAALDHIAVSLVPHNRRSKAKFVIVRTNIWEKD